MALALPHKVITSLTDATSNWEWLRIILGNRLDDIETTLDTYATSFLQLLIPETLALDRGTDSITGTGAATQSKTINHSLGRVPEIVLFSTITASALRVYSLTARTTTNFTVQAIHTTGAVWSSTIDFEWVAIG